MYVVFCFLVFGCQYECNQLPGKTCLRNDILYAECDVKPYTLTHPPRMPDVCVLFEHISQKNLIRPSPAICILWSWCMTSSSGNYRYDIVADIDCLRPKIDQVQMSAPWRRRLRQRRPIDGALPTHEVWRTSSASFIPVDYPFSGRWCLPMLWRLLRDVAPADLRIKSSSGLSYHAVMCVYKFYDHHAR